MVLFLSLALAADPLHDCAQGLLAQASPSLQAEIKNWGHEGFTLDESEKRLKAGNFAGAADLIGRSVRENDRPRADRLLARLLADVQALPADPPEPVVKGESALARAYMALGDRTNALIHLKAAGSHPDSFELDSLLIATIVVGESKTELEKRYVGVDTNAFEKLESLISLSRLLGYANAGRAVLTANYPGLVAALPLGDKASQSRAHDDVLAAAIEGASAVKDWQLVADLLLQLNDDSEVLRHATDLVHSVPTDPRMKAWVAAALKREAKASDFTRSIFVFALTNNGFANEAVLVASHFQDPALRARGEAEAAKALVMVDRAAGLALARTARTHADAVVVTNDNRSDLEAARAACDAAEVRTGETRPGANVYDLAYGLVNNPTARQAWWSTLAPDDRARLMASADRGGWPANLIDRTVWTEMCLGR